MQETTGNLPQALEAALVQGDLSKLSAEHRVMYYNRVCESLGLNPLTRPFDYITLNGKLTLYAKRDATDQLRKIHNINIEIVSQEKIGDLYVVSVKGTDVNRRFDSEIGVVDLKGLAGDKLANAMMKAVTKAKRRVTLSLAGLGMLDETEAETIPTAVTVHEVQPKRLPSPIVPPAPKNVPIEQPSAFIEDAEVQPLDDPWAHKLQAPSERYHGKALKDIPAQWLQKAVKNPRWSKDLSPADAANIVEVLSQIDAKEKAERATTAAAQLSLAEDSIPY